MRVAVTGGRDYDDRKRVNDVLDRLPITMLLHGGAKGADDLCADWADDRRIDSRAFIARWDLHGRPAGPLRNAEILRHSPTLLIAFPGGRGTANMVKQAREADILIIEIDPPPPTVSVPEPPIPVGAGSHPRISTAGKRT